MLGELPVFCSLHSTLSNCASYQHHSVQCQTFQQVTMFWIQALFLYAQLVYVTPTSGRRVTMIPTGCGPVVVAPWHGYGRQATHSGSWERRGQSGGCSCWTLNKLINKKKKNMMTSLMKIQTRYSHSTTWLFTAPSHTILQSSRHTCNLQYAPLDQRPQTLRVN